MDAEKKGNPGLQACSKVGVVSAFANNCCSVDLLPQDDSPRLIKIDFRDCGLCARAVPDTISGIRMNNKLNVLIIGIGILNNKFHLITDFYYKYQVNVKMNGLGKSFISINWILIIH